MRYLVMVLLVACGGAQQESGGGGSSSEEKPETAKPDTNMVSPEAYDEINSFFKKKRIAVTQCQIMAIENGKLDKKAQGRITTEMTISADGKPQGVHVAQSTLGSKSVEDCLVDLIGKWQVPAPGTKVSFSFSYDFHAE
jgi:hypothetical protein